jgi:hypothetical protein
MYVLMMVSGFEMEVVARRHDGTFGWERAGKWQVRIASVSASFTHLCLRF